MAGGGNKKREGRQREEPNQAAKRGSEKGEGAKKVTSSRTVHTVQGRSCGKVNRTGGFQSVFSHLQPSQETIKMSVLELELW